jgi:hypothetical protein
MPVRIDPSGVGGPTPGAARGPRWQKVTRGLYLPAGTPRLAPAQRIAEAVAALPPSAAVTGWGSLYLNGAAFHDGRGATGRGLMPVQVRLPPGCHCKQAGVRCVQGPLEDVVVVHGIRCMPVPVAVFDSMRLRRDVRDAVVDLDMTAAAGLTTVRVVQQYVDARTSWRGTPGVPLVRAALALASDHSASPPETRLRLVWELDARLPRPLVNIPVRDKEGYLLGIPDLFDTVAGLVVEYDGDDHRDARRHSDDVDREAEFRAVGLEVTHVTGRDLARVPRLVQRLHTARGRALFLPPDERQWQVPRR